MIVYECDGCGKQAQGFWSNGWWDPPPSWCDYDPVDKKVAELVILGSTKRHFCRRECGKLWMTQRDYQAIEKEKA